MLSELIPSFLGIFFKFEIEFFFGLLESQLSLLIWYGIKVQERVKTVT